MRVLFTADWQTNVLNIPACRQAADRLLALCKKRKLDTVCIAGDLKAAYNPIDLRVIKFWTEFIQEMKGQRLAVVILLGNHDRMGLYNDDQNWLSILENAGATCFSGPGFYPGHNRENLVLLPFSSNPERWNQMRGLLANEREVFEANRPVSTRRDVLVFHQSIAGTKASKAGQILDGVPLSDLDPSKYLYCIGGHIHLCQRIGENVHYVGSPFAMDWGEANQTKYFAVLEGDQLSFLPTGMPGWYDPAVKGFKPPSSWKGARVRIQVPVPKGGNYGGLMTQARRAAEIKYEGAIVTTVPKFEDADQTKGEVDPDLPESQQIAEYIGKVLPVELAKRQEEMLNYVTTMVQRTGTGIRSTTGVKFVRGWAKGFLSFKELDIELGQGGVVLVTGRNLDWPGKSNGSGKTSALSVIPAAIFGRTFKGQAFDTLVQQGYTGTSVVGASFQTADGRLVRVQRSRNPTKVQLWVNDTEISAGSKSADVSKEAEKLCGFSWDTFAMTVYLDQEEVGNFLWGTPKQKEETLAQLQNLERFAKAQVLVKDTLKEVERVVLELEDSCQIIETKLSNQTETELVDQNIEKSTVVINMLGERIAAWAPYSFKREQAYAEELRVLHDVAVKSYLSASDSWHRLQEEFSNFEKWSKESTCSQCGQPILKGKFRVMASQLSKQMESLRVNRKAREVNAEACQKAWKAADRKFREASEEASVREFQKAEWERQLKQEKERREEWYVTKKQMKNKAQEWHQAKQLLKVAIKSYQSELQFLGTASTILARDGLPTYLSQLICPKLNRAAEYFSELFTESEIQVRFAIDDAGVSVRVVNANGGREMGDQSTGERRMAALITSFALREVTVKSNVLILDEPGDGLDSSNAQVFARGVRQMKDKFGTIFVMTHNANIEAELAGEKSIIIEKQNGVSRIV